MWYPNPKTPTERVANGIQLMDERGPTDWRDRVVVTKLLESDNYEDVASQTFGMSYTGSMERLGLESGYDYGFSAEEDAEEWARVLVRPVKNVASGPERAHASAWVVTVTGCTCPESWAARSFEYALDIADLLMHERGGRQSYYTVHEGEGRANFEAPGIGVEIDVRPLEFMEPETVAKNYTLKFTFAERQAA